MRPVAFPEADVTYGANQSEYQPLPAWSDEKQVISCWALDWTERLHVLWTGRVWLRQMNYGHPLQAQLVEARSPFRQLTQVERVRARLERAR